MLHGTISYFLDSKAQLCGRTRRPRKKLCDKHLNVLSLNTMNRLKKYPEGGKGNHWELGFIEKTSFWPRLLVGYITANGWLATASHRGISNFSISLVCSKKFKYGKNKVNW